MSAVSVTCTKSAHADAAASSNTPDRMVRMIPSSVFTIVLLFPRRDRHGLDPVQPPCDRALETLSRSFCGCRDHPLRPSFENRSTVLVEPGVLRTIAPDEGVDLRPILGCGSRCHPSPARGTGRLNGPMSNRSVAACRHQHRLGTRSIWSGCATIKESSQRRHRLAVETTGSEAVAQRVSEEDVPETRCR